jgi:hypothetical protein
VIVEWQTLMQLERKINQILIIQFLYFLFRDMTARLWYGSM